MTSALLIVLALAGSNPAHVDLDAAAAARLADLALECVHREYPNKIAHVMSGDEDLRPPRDLTPAFYGCFDWHSAVHGHWLLVRLTRMFPAEPFAARARAALAQSITAENIEVEVSYLSHPGRATFERPYGLAWLLQLSAELHEWDDDDGRALAAIMVPVEQIARKRFADWLPKLSHPIRTGEHSQSAFAMGMVLDWARSRGDRELEDLVARRSRDYYLDDRVCNLTFEPSGQDFLSPCLSEADLMRRVLPKIDYAVWLARFMPEVPIHGGAEWLEPAVVTDASDGKLAHLDGLNLSRAWMLEGIASGLPEQDPRIAALLGAAGAHRRSGLAAVTGEHYEGGHWLGSFATYLTSERGL